MPRTLAEAKTKLTILLAEPEDPAAPTVAELEAGMDASCRTLLSDFTFGADASETIDEKTLCTQGSAQTLGSSNHSASFTLFRYFKAGTAEAETTAGADDIFQAIKTKGTNVWLYARKGDKLATEAWEEGDEIYCAVHGITDVPQQTETEGYIKTHHVILPQNAWDYITVAADD